MNKIATVLACLACVGHGQRESSQPADRQKALATLFLASKAAPAAFNSFVPAGQMSSGNMVSRGSPEMVAKKDKVKPLAPGTNYPQAGVNQMTQSSGFGTWLQSFQLTTGKSKYGVPIFLDNGNINPEYLALERAESNKAKKKNYGALNSMRKKLIAKKEFELSDWIRKNVGEVGASRKWYEGGGRDVSQGKWFR